jgi:uncharacterized membrane protein YukC
MRLGNESMRGARRAHTVTSNGTVKSRGSNITLVKGMTPKQLKEAEKAAKKKLAEKKERQDRSKRRQAEQLAKKRERSRKANGG